MLHAGSGFDSVWTNWSSRERAYVDGVGADATYAPHATGYLKNAYSLHINSIKSQINTTQYSLNKK